MARKDPLRNFRFRLEIDGIQQANFSEVAIGENTSDVIDYRDGNEPTHVRKLSGLTKYGNVTLKWGTTDPGSSPPGTRPSSPARSRAIASKWRSSSRTRPDRQGPLRHQPSLALEVPGQRPQR